MEFEILFKANVQHLPRPLTICQIILLSFPMFMINTVEEAAPAERMDFLGECPKTYFLRLVTTCPTLF